MEKEVDKKIEKEETASVSKNFIEQIIEKDLAEGRSKPFHPISAGAKRLSAHWPCEINSFKLWTGKRVWRKV